MYFGGSGVLVKDGGARCPKHPGGYGFTDRGRGSRHQRGYGSEWDRQREAIMKRDCGLCQACAKQGRVTLARDVDHIIPKAEGGTNLDINLQALCKHCHAVKSKTEAIRGVQRGWGKDL